MAMEDMEAMVLDMAVDTMVDTVDTMASVRLRLSLRPRLRLILTTMEDMAMEDMAVDTMVDIAVDTMVDMAVDTMAMDMAVKKFHRYSYLDSICHTTVYI